MKVFSTLLCLLMSAMLFGQTIKGTVTDAASGEPLIGANVTVDGTNKGTFTNEKGEYALTVDAGTYTVVASYVGYTEMSKEVTVDGDATVDFVLMAGIMAGTEVVVSGSRKPEKLTESPATIVTIHSRTLDEFAGNPGELLARLKGVEYFRAGVAGTGINVRGFNSNFNAKNLQVTDGRFSSLVATGLPFGPLNTVVKEDIERVEVILGPNATLYGPNAHNGLLNTITKDPRKYQGTDLTIGVGNQSTFTTRFRHAMAINDKLAFKVTGEYTRAEEFEYVDSVYIDRVGAFDSLGNPIRDGITEGYNELELDRGIEFFRTEAQLVYSINDRSDLTASYGHSNSTYLSPTNVGRNQIKDWRINYFQLKYSTDHFFAQAYLTTSRTDSTYSIDDRTKQYYRGIDAGLTPEVAAGPFSYQSGALFQDASRRVNGEMQYNNTWGGLELVTGVQYQLDQANSLGTYLLDTSATDYINVSQIGAYAHLKYDFGNGLKAILAARGDNHSVYGFNLVPKLGLVYSSDKVGAFRLTYGQGIAAPTILNMYGNLFSGLILGNAEGFTLIDGTVVEKQRVEKLQTLELGYRGQLVKNKLFLDANAYYNISQDFLSPVTVVGVATQRGDVPMSQVQSGFGAYGGLVATYINFGRFNTYGTDIGLTFYPSKELSATFNYSFFGYSIDETNTENDFNRDGTVNALDLLVNAPRNRMSFGLNYSGDKVFANLFIRQVEAFDYYSSFQIASRSYPDLRYRGTPIIENAKSTDSYNYGPLGGFTTIDVGFGYRINEKFTLAGNVTNLFNVEMREFTAAPPTGRLMSLEFRVHLDAPKKK